MAKETKETVAPARKAVVSRNVNEVTFVHAPFYNLANIRKEALKLIVRTQGDESKVEAIRETLQVLGEVLEVRAAHAAKVRAADVAAARKADEKRQKTADELAAKKATQELESAKALVARLEAQIGVSE